MDQSMYSGKAYCSCINRILNSWTRLKICLNDNEPKERWSYGRSAILHWNWGWRQHCSLEGKAQQPLRDFAPALRVTQLSQEGSADPEK